MEGAVPELSTEAVPAEEKSSCVYSQTLVPSWATVCPDGSGRLILFLTV